MVRTGLVKTSLVSPMTPSGLTLSIPIPQQFRPILDSVEDAPGYKGQIIKSNYQRMIRSLNQEILVFVVSSPDVLPSIKALEFIQMA